MRGPGSWRGGKDDSRHVSRTLWWPGHVKTQGAFLPLRVGGVCGADGERVGVRCSSHHLKFHGVRGVLAPAHCPLPLFFSMSACQLLAFPSLSPFVTFLHFQNRVPKRDKTCQNVPKSDIRLVCRKLVCGRPVDCERPLIPAFSPGGGEGGRRPDEGARRVPGTLPFKKLFW